MFVIASIIAFSKILGIQLKSVNKLDETRRQHHIQLHQVTAIMRKVHIYSALPVLLLMIFFAVTGILLNHPELEMGEVDNKMSEIQLPDWAGEMPKWPQNYGSHSLVLLQWLDKEHDIRGVDFSIEWDDYDQLLIVDLTGPNGSTVIEVFFADNLIAVDNRQLSTIAMLNNLHRAKHVSGFWRAVSDLSAVCMLLFCISGFWLVVVNRLERVPANISMVMGGGIFIFALYLMH